MLAVCYMITELGILGQVMYKVPQYYSILHCEAKDAQFYFLNCQMLFLFL